jgi:hypothetical protein
MLPAFPADSKVDLKTTKALKIFLYENFGHPDYRTWWYGLIKEIKVYSDGQDKWAYVKTPIYRDDEGKRVATFLAKVILGSNMIGRVEIDDKDGLPLAMELKY